MRERPAGKAFGRVGVQARCMESHLHCSIQWGRQSAALSREAPGARENTSSVVSMPSGAVETQWQVPAVEAISKTIMILRCLGPMKAPRAGVRGRVVCASRFRGPGMATEECWGAPLHQLVHNPETGERPVHIPWPEEFFSFFFFFRGKVTANQEGSLPLRVPSSGCTAG